MRMPAPALAQLADFLASVWLLLWLLRVALLWCMMLRIWITRPSLLSWSVWILDGLYAICTMFLVLLYFKFARGMHRQIALAEQNPAAKM